MGRRYRKRGNKKSAVKSSKKKSVNTKNKASTQNDEVCVATRVPAEIWDIIATNLDTSKDLHSLSQAVPVCWNFLHETKAEWLFDQVLPVLIMKKAGLERKDVLNCRSVCKKWHTAVGKLYDCKKPPSDPRDEEAFLIFHRQLGNYGFLSDEMKPSRMFEILHHPRALSSSPVFARYLELTVPYDTVEENEIILDFFRKFGKHIYYVDVHCNPGNGLELFSDLLHSYLQYTPNLKHLGVWKFTFFIEDNRVMTRSVKGMTTEMDEFMQSELAPLKQPIESLNFYTNLRYKPINIKLKHN